MAKWNDDSDYTFEKKEKQEVKITAPVPVKKAPYMPPPQTSNYNSVYKPVVVEEQLEEKAEFDNLAKLQNNLNNSLKIIDDEVMKGYLTKLETLPILEVKEEEFKKNLKPIQFFKITELVYEEEEFSVYKLSTLFNSLCNNKCTLVLMLKSDGVNNDFYLGVRSNSEENSSATMMKTLKNSLMGLFPGSQVADYYNENIEDDMQELKINCISSVSCVADFRQKEDGLDDKKFVQGLEKFINSMQGRSYQAIFIAENIGYDNLMKVKRDYEGIYTQISPFTNTQLNFSTSESTGSSKGESEGRTQTTGKSNTKGTSTNQSSTKTDAEGTSIQRTSSEARGFTNTTSDGNASTKGSADGTSHNEGTSRGKSFGGGLFGGIMGGLGFGLNLSGSINNGTTTSNGTTHTDTTSNSISKTLSHGITSSHTDSISTGTNRSHSDAQTVGTGTNESETDSFSESINFVNSLTKTDTFGKSQGMTLNSKNMTLQSITERLEKQLKRIEECESFGMWNFSAYFIGDNIADTESPANIYHSIVSGTKSGIECSAINSWSDKNSLKLLTPYVKNFVHPYFIYNGFDYDKIRKTLVTPAVLVSTNELSIQMGLPYSSVKGLPVIKHAKFAQEVLTRKNKEEKEIDLGNVYHLGAETKTPVKLDLNSLTMHTFVTGSTGSGKSNSIYNILTELKKENIPFLVIEPAKGEYKTKFPNVRCFGTNPKIGEILQLNPFSFPNEVHVLEHIDRLVEIFNVCWPMYAAMPAVLKDSIERAYLSIGWDMDESENTKIDGLFPTFDDVLRELNKTINSSDYSADTKGDYIGSLSTRLKSLTNGINGKIFTAQEMDLDILFNQNAIVDTSRVGSMETKALIMGLLILKLQEFRYSNAMGTDLPLKHITVLEEAHNILKKTSTEQSTETANLQGKSVEMLANTIAEIRTYGEGFIIVDQAPNLLDTASIRNTNTKIVFRLPEGNDRKITGTSMALTDIQIDELSKLPTGVACIYQNDWHEAVLCKLPKFTSSEKLDVQKISKSESQKEKNDWILHQLLKKEYSEEELAILKDSLIKSNISSKIKLELILNIEKKNLEFEYAVASFINKNYKYTDVFRKVVEESSSWNNVDELLNMLTKEISKVFTSFDEKERNQILLYICKMKNENIFDSQIIEALKDEVRDDLAIRIVKVISSKILAPKEEKRELFT